MAARIVQALALSFLSFALAHPVPIQFSVSAAQILFIAPNSSTCEGAPFPNECRDANQAAAAISDSFCAYGITSPNEQAALISTMAFETGDFKYNINHFPGIPGQGTRNMQSPKYILQYAQSILALSSSLQDVENSPTGVLALLTANEAYDFGSAAWYLTTICTQADRMALRSEGLAGWQRYVSSCIGTTATDAREVYWQKAAQAFRVFI